MRSNPFRLSLLVIAALAASSALAGGNSNNSGDTTNNNQTYNQGGSGGTSSAIAGAAAASNAVSGSSASVKSSNAQQQGQMQSNESRNTNSNRATGGNSQASVGGNNNTVGPSSNTSNQGVTVDARNQSTYQAQERDPVNSAYSAGLVASNGTCMGSSSFGGTGPGFSATFGTTWKDNDCSIRYTAEALRASGNNSIAQALLCTIPEVAKVAPKHCREVTTKLADPVAAMDEKVQEIVAKQTFVPLLP